MTSTSSRPTSPSTCSSRSARAGEHRPPETDRDAPSRSPAGDADEVVVKQDGNADQRDRARQRGGFFGGDYELDIAILVPTDSNLVVRTGSADVTVHGHLRRRPAEERFRRRHDRRSWTDRRASRPAPATSGSTTPSSELKVKSGSGDVRVATPAAPIAVSTGSGDVEIGDAQRPGRREDRLRRPERRRGPPTS